MSKLKFLGTGDVCRRLDATQARLSHAAKRAGIEPVGRLPGGRKLWSVDQIPALRKALADCKERNRNALAYENG